MTVKKELKPTLKGLTLSELENQIRPLSEKDFHARQIYKWLYQKKVGTFREMTDLSKALRHKLAQRYRLQALTLKQQLVSQQDQTRKFLFELVDHHYIESVLMFASRRVTVCLSVMVGCPLGCPFCATGQMGLVRPLSSAEILNQFLWIDSHADRSITNVVLMGMGEPFLNYEPTIKAAKILNTELGPGISARKITISTAGIIPGIYRYADERQRFKLAISLNATNNQQRSQLMPLNKKYPLEDLLAAARYYTRKLKRRITFEYMLIRAFNDSLADATRLRQMLSAIPCKLNLIPFNETPHSPYQAPTEKQLDAFIQAVYQAPFAVTVRRSKGADIAAACGQLYAEENTLRQES